MNYKIIELEQGSTEWLAFRKNHITATDTASILGVAYKKTALQLWEEKLGLREPEPENDRMRQGKTLEEEARKFLNNREENDFEPIVLESTIYPFMMASLDGMNSEGDIIEIKCGGTAYMNILSNRIEPYYYSQCQKQMFVSGENRIYYFVYLSPEKNKGITLDRNDDFIEKMIEAEKEFYCCLMNFTPPLAIDRDFVKRDDDAWYFRSKEWKDVKRQLKELEEKEELLRADLIKMCDGHSSQGNGIRISKSIRKGNIDYSSIDLLKNVDLEAYRKKPSTYYRITDSDQ